MTTPIPGLDCAADSVQTSSCLVAYVGRRGEAKLLKYTGEDVKELGERTRVAEQVEVEDGRYDDGLSVFEVRCASGLLRARRRC